MSIVKDLHALLKDNFNAVPYDIGFFDNDRQHGQPDEYIVIVPLADEDIFADNMPISEIQSARLSLFMRGDYLERKRQLTTALRDAGFVVSDRRYAGYERNTKYHHYIIEAEAHYYEQE